MSRIKLVKIQELPDAKHPNNIEEGYAKIGAFVDYPVVGESFYVGLNWRTSTVVEIISFNTFKTLNSIYKIIPLED